MKNLILAPLLIGVAISCASAFPLLAEPLASEPVAQTEAEARIAAQKAAISWLALVDAGKYGASMDQAAAIFKERVTLEEFEKSVRPYRNELGQVESRRLDSTSYTKTLPDAPDGEYVIIQYDSTFEQNKSVRETIIPTKEKDGQWRVAGYFLLKARNVVKAGSN